MSRVTLQFLGAVGTVTGSKFAVKTSGSHVLVDCGMFQGLKELRLRNWEKLPIDVSALDAVVLTHAHLDHCGYLPALVKHGFKGPIYGTEWTLKLAEVILRDSAKLQMEDAEYARKKGFSKHQPAKALYEEEDVERTIALFRPIEFFKTTAITDDVSVLAYPCGHVLGAAFLEMHAGNKRILFTGDMGRSGHPILRAPERIPTGHFDAVLAESTYGNRTHEVPSGAFADAINRTLKRKGSVLIPAFAVDRTEVILMELRRLMDQQIIPRVPIFADSPMALTTLNYYRAAIKESSLEIRPEISEAYKSEDLFDPGSLNEVTTIEASKRLNNPSQPCIIISASGMATGGRVVHHLEGMLPNPKNSVLLVGYQAAGTRGRSLLDGVPALKMYGKYVQVKAEIVQVGEFSVHADSGEMIEWLSDASTPPSALFVIHGEEEAAATFAHTVHQQLGWMTVLPKPDEIVQL
jgi:metallo-beta-lactamase family protein